MGKPLLVILNGLPGTGKTTLARRLAADTKWLVLSRDGLYETLYDALDCRHNGTPARLGIASFRLLYTIAGAVLTTGHSVIVEGFFGRPELRTAEFLDLQRTCGYEPFQIMCRADGNILLERFLMRMNTETRHTSHQDQEWLDQNRDKLLQGHIAPLALGGRLVEIDTTTTESFNYDWLLQQVRDYL